MKNFKIVASHEAPSQKDVLWARPIGDSFVLYLLESGVWKPLKLADDNSTQSIVDDTVQNLVGSVQDESTANTINGAKTYADEAAEAVVGTADDTAADMTLYGLKAYIDAQLADLG